ncbi:anti-sigma factor family protein [Armatimonas sp.]|uniref:anti-sigma factor n=1 Tax=Armatimonas sp. TaxID=1872638 RepID=UPI0037512A30
MPEPRPSVQECRSSLQEELKAYLDAELPPLRRAAVERHLGTCPACQTELASLRQLSVQLSEALPSAAVLPDALRARILRSLPDAPAPRPLLFPFWRRPGPLVALGGALAMGCAFWLWVRVPESGKPMASSSPIASATLRANENKAQKPRATMQYQNSQQEARKASALASVHESASSLKASRPVSVSPGDFKGVASAAKRVRLSPPAAPATPLSDGEPEAASKNDKDSNRSPKADFEIRPRRMVTGGGIALPSVYTLTVAPGKRAETLEAIRKLAGELSVTLASEQPDLDLRLALDGREALLDRLKALGKLAESKRLPSAPEKPHFGANPSAEGVAASGAGGFGGGGGGATPKSQPQLKLTLIVKELKPEELP